MNDSYERRTGQNHQRIHKLVIEIAGNDLEACCGEHITCAAVRHGPGRIVEPQRSRALIDDGSDHHRCQVVIAGLTPDPRRLFLDPGCSEAGDGACPIPLQAAARPVDLSTQSLCWPTVLIPLVPLACIDTDQCAEEAEPLRNGWLYVYLNGRLWRELYVCGDHTFRDVNLALPSCAGRDERAPTGRALACVVVPQAIDARPQGVAVAFSEVQWSWHKVCAMGGPADDDPRFTSRMIAQARRVPVDARRRDRRFTVLDLSGYPIGFDTPDGRVRDIATAPCAFIDGVDPLQHYRSNGIAAVYLPDPLGAARRLADAHQQAWRDMENFLQELIRAPEICTWEGCYEAGRWFDSALLANRFFFSPFPSFGQWRRLRPGDDRQQWRRARRQRAEMAARLDKTAIDEALGAHRREELHLAIDCAKKRLVDFLSLHFGSGMDLLLLMIEDYFPLPNRHDAQDGEGKSAIVHEVGWSLVQRLIARLADHSHALDRALASHPPDGDRTTPCDPGLAFLRAIADPAHPLHARWFPKPGFNAWTSDMPCSDREAPHCKCEPYHAGVRALYPALPLLLLDTNAALEEWVSKGPFAKEMQDPPAATLDPAPIGMPPLRFDGHRPGEVAWGPPPGGVRQHCRYPGSCDIFEFWKEPDGSFIWLNPRGEIVDWKINANGRLRLKGRTLYLKLPDDEVPLGRMFRPIRNRERLLVDRSDNGNRFRNWCEMPDTACRALIAALFTPRIAMDFSRRRAIAAPKSYAERVYHAAQPSRGYVYTAHVHVVLPWCIENKSRLHMEVAERACLQPETTTVQKITRTISPRIDPGRTLCQMTLDWRLGWRHEQRHAWVTVKARLDLYGDGTLCLPLDKKDRSGGPADWIVLKHRADRDRIPETSGHIRPLPPNAHCH